MKAVVASAVLLVACADPAADPVPRGQLLVEDACAPRDLASSGSSLFWIAECDGSIRKASKLDGAVEILVLGEPSAAMLTVDDNFVYWARIPSGSAGEVVRVSQLGGPVVVLATAQDEMYGFLPQQLVVDDATVYRSRFFEILEMPKDGSAPQQVFGLGNSGPFLATDAEYVYWASIRTVHRQRKGSTFAEQLAETTFVIADPIAITDTAVFYWVSGDLFRVEKATGGPPTQVTLQAGRTGGAYIADRLGQLYWKVGSHLVRVTEDGAAVRIAQSDDFVSDFALDGDHIYWIESEKIYSAVR